MNELPLTYFTHHSVHRISNLYYYQQSATQRMAINTVHSTVFISRPGLITGKAGNAGNHRIAAVSNIIDSDRNQGKP